MRQLCNVSYAIQTEWMEKKEIDQFQAELHSDPSKPTVPYGAINMMQMMRRTSR